MIFAHKITQLLEYVNLEHRPAHIASMIKKRFMQNSH